MVLLLPLLVLLCSSMAASAGNFYRDFDLKWGDGQARILNEGKLLTLSLDAASGSSIESKNEYLFGRFDMQIKLVPGDSAGTVTTFYLTSEGPTHDEIDFEFLGNLSGDPYILHTNVYTNGSGGREQQLYLWFDPTADFHTYSIIWTPQRIILAVDGTPIREFKNLESIGVPYASHQPMKVLASIWNAEYWATRGGAVKTDWSKAPFVATYRRFHAQACVWSAGKSSCDSNSTFSSPAISDERLTEEFMTEDSDFIVEESIKWVQKYYMIYNHCTDLKKYYRGLPAECVVGGSKKIDDVESI